MVELVGAEDVAVVEGRQVVDVDLSRLEEQEEKDEDAGGDQSMDSFLSGENRGTKSLFCKLELSLTF